VWVRSSNFSSTVIQLAATPAILICWPFWPNWEVKVLWKTSNSFAIPRTIGNWSNFCSFIYSSNVRICHNYIYISPIKVSVLTADLPSQNQIFFSQGRTFFLLFHLIWPLCFGKSKNCLDLTTVLQFPNSWTSHLMGLHLAGDVFLRTVLNTQEKNDHCI